MTPLLEVQELAVTIPVDSGDLQAVRGVDFKVHAGETFCLVGESGCGKSLTALALMGLLPSRARLRSKVLRYAGLELRGLPGRAMADLRGKEIAMIFQDPMTSLNPTLTVGWQLIEGLVRHTGAGSQAAREQATELLERVGIADPRKRLDQYPHQFSGGQRQRIMIAMALMCRPKLLIADEPTTALDVTIQAQILSLLAELRREMNLALLLISHDLGIVARIADRVAVMYAGRIVEEGPVAAVFADPGHPYTRGLIGAIPIPGRTAPGSRLVVIAGRVPELTGVVYGCAFRDRCIEARPSCTADPIPEQQPAFGHRYACRLGPGWRGGDT